MGDRLNEEGPVLVAQTRDKVSLKARVRLKVRVTPSHPPSPEATTLGRRRERGRTRTRTRPETATGPNPPPPHLNRALPTRLWRWPRLTAPSRKAEEAVEEGVAVEGEVELVDRAVAVEPNSNLYK